MALVRAPVSKEDAHPSRDTDIGQNAALCLLQVRSGDKGEPEQPALRTQVLGMGTGCCPREGGTRTEDVTPWRSCNGPGGGIRADFLEDAIIGLSFEDRSGC